eukprot:m.586478 g.586478  ORF g.586478 m.586478 type:complete len:202 (-) comp22344_c1_seq2:419-1024(-)
MCFSSEIWFVHLYRNITQLENKTGTRELPFFMLSRLQVGRRLSLVALAQLYGQDVEYQGPVVKSYTVHQTTSTITVSLLFENANGLHLDGSATCTFCCNGTSSGSPLYLVDPDQGTMWEPAGKTYATEFTVDPTQGTLTASVTGFRSVKGRAQIELMMDNAPECVVYNGVGGPNDHRGIVGVSWRQNVTLPSVGQSTLRRR